MSAGIFSPSHPDLSHRTLSENPLRSIASWEVVRRHKSLGSRFFLKYESAALTGLHGPVGWSKITVRFMAQVDSVSLRDHDS